MSFEETAKILRNLTPGFESGEFPPPQVLTFPLTEGPKVYREMHEGGSRRKRFSNPKEGEQELGKRTSKVGAINRSFA